MEPLSVSPDDATAVVDLAAVRHNLTVVRGLIRPGTKVLAAVKANAYGHGLVAVAAELERAGVDHFGVATAGEALALREAGISTAVLVLSPVRDRATISRLAEAGVDVTVTDESSVEQLVAADLPRRLKVQVCIDTGMGRLGLVESSAPRVVRRVVEQPRLELAGVWTHFADADGTDPAFTLGQIDRFETALEGLEREGLRPPLVHAANSAGTIAYPQAHYAMVRAGIILYGQHASPTIRQRSPALRPAMRLEAPITFVKRVEPGTPISYGCVWRAAQPTTIATVRLGYADGYPRQLTGKGWAAVRGVRCEVVGRVCMDQLMLDVGAVPDVQPGERAVLWGAGGPDAEELASSFGTISYELLTGVGSRVRRVYLP